jgi:hypothetical protein
MQGSASAPTEGLMARGLAFRRRAKRLIDSTGVHTSGVIGTVRWMNQAQAASRQWAGPVNFLQANEIT